MLDRMVTDAAKAWMDTRRPADDGIASAVAKAWADARKRPTAGN